MVAWVGNRDRGETLFSRRDDGILPKSGLPPSAPKRPELAESRMAALGQSNVKADIRSRIASRRLLLPSRCIRSAC
jgi:hypothetical protein